MVSFRGCLVLGGWDSSIFLNNLAQAIDLFCITGNLKAIVQQCATRSCHHHQIPLLLLCSLKPKTHSTWNSEHFRNILPSFGFCHTSQLIVIFLVRFLDFYGFLVSEAGKISLGLVPFWYPACSFHEIKSHERQLPQTSCLPHLSSEVFPCWPYPSIPGNVGKAMPYFYDKNHSEWQTYYL